MSYAVRDRLRARYARPVPQDSVDEEGFARVFADSVAYFRETCPDLYERAELELARPGRSGQQDHGFDPTIDVRECLWCGDDYPAYGAESLTHCCVDCVEAHIAYDQTRMARGVEPTWEGSPAWAPRPCRHCRRIFAPLQRAMQVYCQPDCRHEQHNRSSAERKRRHRRSIMAMDQAQQYLEDAEALERNANIAAFFAALSDTNEGHAEQIRSDEDCLRRWAELDRQLAAG